MEKKKVTLKIYGVDLVVAIGRQQELKKFVEQSLESKEFIIRESFRKRNVFEELKKTLDVCGGICIKAFQSTKTGNPIYLALIFSDELGKVGLKFTGNKKKYKKKVKIGYYHELRHMADQIIEDKRMKFEDREMSAYLQGFIYSEFDNLMKKYFKKELPKVIEEIQEN